MSSSCKTRVFLLVSMQILGLGFKLTTISVTANHIRHRHHRLESDFHSSDGRNHNHSHYNSNNNNNSSLNMTNPVNTNITLDSIDNVYINIDNSSESNDKKLESSKLISDEDKGNRSQVEKINPEESQFSVSVSEHGFTANLNTIQNRSQSPSPPPSPVQSGKSNKNVPTFLNIFHNLLVSSASAMNYESNPTKFRGGTGERERSGAGKPKSIQTLTRAWFPKSFTYDEMGNFIISFSTNSTHREQLKDFLGAQIIFTRRNDSFKTDGENVSIKYVTSSHTNGDVKLIQSSPLPITEQNRFYCFDVTGEMFDVFNKNTRHVNDADDTTFAFKIQRTSDHIGSRLSFLNYFDTDNDKPFILIRYQEFPSVVMPQTINDNRQNNGNSERTGVRRRKRTAFRRNIGTNNSGRNSVSLTNKSNSTSSSSSKPFRNKNVNLPNTKIDGKEWSANTTGKEVYEDKDAEELLENNNLDLLIYEDRNVEIKSDVKNNTKSQSVLELIINRKNDNDPGKTYEVTRVRGKEVNLGNTKTKLPPQVNLPESNSHLCKRHPWLINPYSDIDWDHAHSSQLLDLGFCAGECPYPLTDDRFNFTTHSHIIDRLRVMKSSAELPKNFPKPCCVPISYKDSMLLLDDGIGGFSLDLYNDFSVTACGCR